MTLLLEKTILPIPTPIDDQPKTVDPYARDPIIRPETALPLNPDPVVGTAVPEGVGGGTPGYTLPTPITPTPIESTSWLMDLLLGLIGINPADASTESQNGGGGDSTTNTNGDAANTDPDVTIGDDGSGDDGDDPWGLGSIMGMLPMLIMLPMLMKLLGGEGGIGGILGGGSSPGAATGGGTTINIVDNDQDTGYAWV
jgi:hypothetical protein